MRYIKTTNFDKFKCIADRCPESCCIGWQIVIDDLSLERYRSMTGTSGRLVDQGVDFETGVFRQYGRRCSMLSEEGLCKLQMEAGEGALCRTCALYPRHIEEYEGEREYSLSLSCPEAARIILENKSPAELISWYDDEEELMDDFDDLLYQVLCDARNVIFRIIRSSRMNFIVKTNLILTLGRQLHECLEDDLFFEMNAIIDDYTMQLDRMDKGEAAAEGTAVGGAAAEGASGVSAFPALCVDVDFDREKRDFSKLFEMEFFHDDWEGQLFDTFDLIFGDQGETLQETLNLSEEFEMAAQHLLLFFIFTYFCGAVYDDMIYSKTALCISSVKWIFYMEKAMELSGKARSEESRMELLIRAAYRYAREIEHSDLNLDALEDWFDMSMRH